MLQRIQTIYLVIGLICTGLLFYFPVWNSGDATGMGSYGAGSHLVLFLLTSLLGTIQMISIFLFRIRKLQLTFCWIALLMALSYISLVLILYMEENQGLTNFTSGIQWSAILPILIILLKHSAIRNIKKDEELIRSMNRLR